MVHGHSVYSWIPLYSYSGSQVYEYIARVFIMSNYQHISDQMPRKNEFNISTAVLLISGLLIYLE